VRSYLYRILDYVPGTGGSVWLVNVLAQRILRLDGSCRYTKHFTTRVMHSRGLTIEEECPKVRRSLAVSGGCYINAADGLWIGKGTIWAANVAIVSQDHDRENLDDAPLTRGIRIGRDCWLGFGCVILPGVTLGERTIVGANAVVTRSFPVGNQMIAGAPARIVNRRVDSATSV